MNTEADVLVTIADLRAAKLCNAGSRRVGARYGLSWTHFVTHGYCASVLRAFGDPLFDRVVAEAYKRVGRQET